MLRWLILIGLGWYLVTRLFREYSIPATSRQSPKRKRNRKSSAPP